MFGLILALGSQPAAARDAKDALAGPITAIWRLHRIAFEYQGFNVRYSCSGLQGRLRSILKAVGAHDDIDVGVDCTSDSLISSATMLLTFKMPVVASEANVRTATTYTTQQELVAQLKGVRLPTANDLERFTAQWRNVSLGRNRKLGLDSGDCDLLTGVNKQLLPQLGITTQDFDCHKRDRRTRVKFKVAALVPIEPPAR